MHRNAKCDPIFGKQVTADHVYAHSERLAGFTGDLDLLVIFDRSVGWIEGYPLRSKGADDAYNSFQDFRGSALTWTRSMLTTVVSYANPWNS